MDSTPGALRPCVVQSSKMRGKEGRFSNLDFIRRGASILLRGSVEDADTNLGIIEV